MIIDLIFPGITFCGFNAFGMRRDNEGNFMPHGLASIAAYLKSKGHSVNVIDMRKLAGWEHFEHVIMQSPANVFGISTMSCDYGVSEKAAVEIKKYKPSSVIVIGGVHPTVAAEEVLKNKVFDFIITGEGEYSLCDLLERLGQNGSPERMLTGMPVDLATLPWADRDMFDYDNGEKTSPLLPHMKPPFVSVMTSRGCPYRCRFCQPSERMVFGNKVKIRPVVDVINELVHLREKYRFNSFLIHDDLFILKPAYVEEFVTKYRKNGFTQKFTCQARADIIVNLEDNIRMLADAGLDCLMIGIESGSQKMLDFMDKGTTVAQNRKAVEICRKYNIKVYANIMFGLPTETKEDMDATVSFVRQMKPDYVSPSVFTPYPGSYLYDYCKEKDLLLPVSEKSYRRNPLGGAKLKGVKYWLVNFEIFKAAPVIFIFIVARKIIGSPAANFISAIIKRLSKPSANYAN
ncbi:MAG: B12-binding domain-containing radical SAM protein [Nitrospirae bacterium]|nr:B12-binding domain-containing radical SAM protein [Nitrospirota bacterium]